MLHKIIFGMLLLFPLSARTEDLVLQKQECEDRLAGLIGGAESYIDVSVYSINNRRLVDALLAAHGRGVRVRILTDRLQASGKTSRVMQLRGAGIPVRIRTGTGVMHTKVAIYDGISVSSGSLNWTEAAVNKNDEVCDIFTDRPDYAGQHQRLFDERWGNASQEKSDEWFNKRDEPAAEKNTKTGEKAAIPRKKTDNVPKSGNAKKSGK